MRGFIEKVAGSIVTTAVLVMGVVIQVVWRDAFPASASGAIGALGGVLAVTFVFYLLSKMVLKKVGMRNEKLETICWNIGLSLYLVFSLLIWSVLQ